MCAVFVRSDDSCSSRSASPNWVAIGPGQASAPEAYKAKSAKALGRLCERALDAVDFGTERRAATAKRCIAAIHIWHTMRSSCGVMKALAEYKFRQWQWFEVRSCGTERQHGLLTGGKDNVFRV
eukprot:3275087-Pleurochrysis_carterae.AAC.4